MQIRSGIQKANKDFKLSLIKLKNNQNMQNLQINLNNKGKSK